MPPVADPLAAYNSKRDFARTAEPRGARGRTKGGNRFIVQKHDATRLHFDFRLEMDGVLKSWAVTRGPSLDPGDKRLAVRTEDHPLSYATFEGVIPRGEYGGGTVMLWDEGLWEPVPGKSADDLDKGHLHFRLEGQRMKGEWLLVRLKPRPGEKRENWLLRKLDDDHAGAADALTGRALTSVKTGRTLSEIAADAPAISLEGKKGAAFDRAMKKADAAARPVRSAPRRQRGSKPPAFRAPQLATLVDHVPAGGAWLHEIKYDGYRCQLAVAGDRVTVHSRSGLDWTDRFPAIAAEVAGLDLPAALIDGEIVARDADGNPDFSLLQQRLKAGDGDGFDLFAFDLLSLDGRDLARLPNIARKEKLAALLGSGTAHVHVADHLLGGGEALFDTLCRAGQEGIISKRADAPYRGRRTRNWLKVKCTMRQEFVVIGWTPSGASGRAIRNLLLAQHEGDALVYAGRVGTGFNADNVDPLIAAMTPLSRRTPAVEVPAADARGARWLTPRLVAEIAFAERTAQGRVRHASYLGLREDKPAKAVKPERPEAAPAPDAVAISNRDRLIFPEAKITKGALADYYATMSGAMLPWAAGRPVSLVRCPQGRARQCFFQRHDSGGFGDHVHPVPIREKDGGKADYLYVDDGDGLLACVQMGTIEFHGWGSRVADIERPDRMIFDLDPDEAISFDAVKKAALDLRRALADIGLVSFAMLTGGKGVHVVVPLRPEATWPAVKDFASRFAHALAAAEPDRFTATMSKAKRKGRIFIDWLRNQRGATAILPYAVRARPHAPVAAPVTWDELAKTDAAGHFTVKDADTLLKRASSRALRGWGEADQTLPDV